MKPTISKETEWRPQERILRDTTGDVLVEIPFGETLRRASAEVALQSPGAERRFEEARLRQKYVLPVIRSFAQDLLEDPPHGSGATDRDMRVSVTTVETLAGSRVMQTVSSRNKERVVIVPATPAFEEDLPSVIGSMFPAVRLSHLSRVDRKSIFEHMPGRGRKFRGRTPVVRVIVPAVLKMVEEALRTGAPVESMTYNVNLKTILEGYDKGAKARLRRIQIIREGRLATAASKLG
jgi:hypothetical protein